MKRSLFVFSMLMSFVFAYGESENNDCYWYGRCVYAEFNKNGRPIESKTKYMYPENDDCIFEIQFDYAPHYQKATYPITIYLNEASSEKGRVVKKKIGTVVRGIKSSVNYKSNAVSIFVEGYQITVTSDGKVLIYKVASGAIFKYCYQFEADDLMKPVYKVRYEVLLEKLKSIKWGWE
ncbi:MAG: hypothetical protein IJ160_11195 [Muribaculaceae bacterium]|nr:hypothetical protein [Muribaculaceae bacterium]